MRERDHTDPAWTSIGRWYLGERCAAGCRVVVLDGEGVRKLAPRTRDPLSSRDVLAWLHGERPCSQQPHPPTTWVDSAATLETERLIEAVRPLWAVRR